MNTDIRLSIDFLSHPKTVKLERRLGVGAIKALLQLWLWVARNRPNGELDNMDVEDIEIAAGWTGDSGAFVAALESLRLLDNIDGYAVHNWSRHNGWASRAGEREGKARLSRLCQVNPDAAKALKEQGVTAITRDEYEHYVRQDIGDSPSVAGRSPAIRQRNASLQPAPAPAPSPARKDLQFAQSDCGTPGTNCAETAKGGSTPATDGEESTEEVVMWIPLAPRDGSYAVTESDVQFWAQAYPRVDVVATLRRIASWMDANPNKRKTRRGIRRCIDSWLARDQDNGKTIRVNHSSIGGLTFQ